jgi:hypothetical protein
LFATSAEAGKKHHRHNYYNDNCYRGGGGYGYYQPRYRNYYEPVRYYQPVRCAGARILRTSISDWLRFRWRLLLPLVSELAAQLKDRAPEENDSGAFEGFRSSGGEKFV